MLTPAEKAEIDQVEKIKMNYVVAIDAVVREIERCFPGHPDFYKLKNRVFENLCKDLDQHEKQS